MKQWKGVIIEESLEDKGLLKEVNVLKRKTLFNIFASRRQPKIWHMCDVVIDDNKINSVCRKAKDSIKGKYWYIDLSSGKKAVIIFKGKVFKIRKDDKESITKAKEYGKSVGIPERQLDFDKIW